jgi:hypothetical protein
MDIPANGLSLSSNMVPETVAVFCEKEKIGSKSNTISSLMKMDWLKYTNCR